MKQLLLTLLLLSGAQLLAQKVYLPHEVEKQAEPTGGLVSLNQFILSNLQLPFKSTIQGINAKVFIKGVIEPDGHMSQIEVTRGIDTLCNLEAVRVMALFKAWKPATLSGELVRQNVFYPVSFSAPPRTNFDSTRSALIDYFDQEFKQISDPKQYKYRRIQPVDDKGFVKANVVYEEFNGKKWKMFGEALYKKKEIWYKLRYEDPNVDSVRAYSISARDANEASHATEALFQDNQKLLSYTEFELHNQMSLHKEYDLDGMVGLHRVFTDTLITELTWYPNGQIRSHTEAPIAGAGEKGEPLLLNLWAMDGKQWVRNGDGLWRAVSETPIGKTIYEEGGVVRGVKNGKWVGKLADSTLYYEEVYELGLMETGYSMIDGQKTSYTRPVINPVFKGGIREMYKFLGMNIKYPINAARSGVAGKVMLSFVVCEDGSMCDYKVESGVGFGLDDEALRVVKLMSGLWQPGVMRGQKVRVKYNLPVNFQLAGVINR